MPIQLRATEEKIQVLCVVGIVGSMNHEQIGTPGPKSLQFTRVVLGSAGPNGGG